MAKPTINGAQPTITVEEFRNLGLISEINRRILHPIGLALSVSYDEEGNVTGFGPVFADDDPEGWIYVGSFAAIQENARRVAEREAEWHPRRSAVLGFIVQPVD